MERLTRPSAVCKDCWASATGEAGLTRDLLGGLRWRAAPHPGPRCTTHHRAKKRADKAKSAERRDKSVYGLMPGGYDELKRIQGGRCWICQRATGATRRLSVDHDHATDEVRGLLCRPCNSMLGHGRDDPEFFLRAMGYLENPPANLLHPSYIIKKEG